MIFFKNELQNREENFNSRFAGASYKQTVGVMNAVRSYKNSNKENGTAIITATGRIGKKTALRKSNKNAV